MGNMKSLLQVDFSWSMPLIVFMTFAWVTIIAQKKRKKKKMNEKQIIFFSKEKSLKLQITLQTSFLSFYLVSCASNIIKHLYTSIVMDWPHVLICGNYTEEASLPYYESPS